MKPIFLWKKYIYLHMIYEKGLFIIKMLFHDIRNNYYLTP